MRLGFGCVGLGSAGGGRSVAADVRLVQEAVDLGVAVFDTAAAYGSGASERVLGDALRTRRDEVVLATKGGYVFRERTAPEQAARRLAAGVVRRLPRRGAGGGHAVASGGDAYRRARLLAAPPAGVRRGIAAAVAHRPHRPVPAARSAGRSIPDLFDELVDLRTSGKVLAFGIGAESVAAAVEWLAVPAVACVQVPFGVLDPEAADELFPLLAARPTDVWARGVLGGGLLALAERDPAAAAGDPKAPTIEALRRIADDTGLGLDQLAVGFVRSHAAVSTMLVGISSRAHLQRNVDLMAMAPLDDDVVTRLQTVVEASEAPGAGR